MSIQCRKFMAMANLYYNYRVLGPCRPMRSKPNYTFTKSCIACHFENTSENHVTSYLCLCYLNNDMLYWFWNRDTKTKLKIMKKLVWQLLTLDLECWAVYGVCFHLSHKWESCWNWYNCMVLLWMNIFHHASTFSNNWLLLKLLAKSPTLSVNIQALPCIYM